MRIVCYASKAELTSYVKRRTNDQITFSIGGCDCILATSLVASHDIFYFHWEEENRVILNVIVDTYHRIEFDKCPELSLIEIVAPPERRRQWICAPERGHIWAEPYPNLLADL